ncbi:C2 domain-containing protein 3 [Austrofundulus limnaeus]|uniref:C2 domain-containing protein 3 n=1 Tax=Austrofundulus limnaeus TaxID=52670 RepID=A0A2I4CL06_AUSLI|nr:PREDICTED: C2 domain-containing protein 3 [Austrofundulus limnaeus]
MKNKKQKKRKAPSDVPPSTSLPPLVEGQLRCFLRVTISRVLWTVHKPPPPTFIRLRWWGESSSGTHFFPRDGSQLSQKNIKTTAHFPIRCGPKQFTSYLTDMGSLVLEVLTKPDHLPIARAQVAGISRLSLSQPISGFYTLVSPTSDKLGEVQVSLSLEPLTEAYDSSSSGPATDAVTDGTTLTVPSHHRSPSAGSGKESAGSSGRNTPRGKDHLYFQNVQKDKEAVENQIPTSNKSLISRGVVNHSTENSSHLHPSDDIISVILERGNKLRNAMVASALKCDVDSAPHLKESPLPLPTDNIQLPDKSFPSPAGMFLQDILHADSAQKPSDDAALAADSCLGCPADMDRRAVELLLGSPVTSSAPLWGLQGSPPDSLSGHSSLCGDSELSDPLYDQSLLENLFYKTPNSDPNPDDADKEGQKIKLTAENPANKLTHSGPNESLNPDCQQSADRSDVSHLPLSVDHLSLLSLIRFVKVTIDSLMLPAGGSNIRKAAKGKRPRSLSSQKCTYFVEYVFPKTSASNHPDRSKAGSEEVTRAVSSKVISGAVKFHQVSVFPVRFSTAAIRRWWETDLIFTIYSRTNNQKKPVAVGKAVHPLRCSLQSKELHQSLVVPVQSSERFHQTQQMGPLKVSIELGTHSINVSSEKNKKLTWKDTSALQIPPSPERETVSRPQRADTGREAFSDSSRLNVWTPQKPSEEPSSHPGVQTSPFKSPHWLEEDPEVLLHALLMVPDGKNFSCGPLQAPNVYLNCKLFWSDETARSAVSWAQTNPTFNFVQVTPVALTTKLLERMKNNVMVIEVWQKTGQSSLDRLFGLVKLPLHQFYMSFRDPKISQLLLQAQYPVVGVDSHMPVIDVFSGSCRGNLRVLLAMGRSEQIISLQRTRDDECHFLSHLVRPVHMLDHQSHSQTKVKTSQVEVMTEHVFVIRVEKVSGLMPLQSTVWGEADCYVKYSFPCQEGDVAADMDQSLIESSSNLKPFRTTTTLCVPDMMFGHAETHVLLAPEGVPVQKLLLSSLSAQGLSDGGGILFEVWCRYYYPNVRDQLVAKGLLPLSKLCAMVTMQRQHPNQAQMFSLPLIPRTEGPTGFQPQPSGLLDVYVHYKHRPVRAEGKAVRGAASRVVTVVVEVHRAAGLKAAARAISEENEKFSHFADVGVNSFVTVQLSFLPESERKCTRTAARTFCPEFDYHMEVSCDLLLRMSSGETCSLAEQLERASAVFTVWNRGSHKVNVSNPDEVMLGTVKVPLADLIYKITGISGWFGLYTTLDRSPQHQDLLVGGLEISISFAHPSDRERVVKAARDLGWEPPHRDHDEERWEESPRKLSLTFSVPKAWLPVHCLLPPGLSELQRPTYCYLRWKFFDQDAFCSVLKHPCVEEDGRGSRATVSFEGSRTVDVRLTQPLKWYLREERLEVQLWVTFNKNRTVRPSDSDRLVGSAFVNLSSLAKTPKPKLTLSGMYPLFMRSAADLQGAALRVHIVLTAGSVPANTLAECDTQVDSDSQEELSLQEVEVTDHDRSSGSHGKSHTPSRQKGGSFRATPDITSVHRAELTVDESFSVTVAVDRAMHLNLKGCPLAERSEEAPCCCVSYVTADSAEPVSTAVVANSHCPVWDHQRECRLSKELLVDPQQSFVLKVWHKGEIERVIGFACVDLSPLLCGFSSVCGWYNITDFSGQCHGQIKVSVTPLKGVQELRGQRKTVSEEAATHSPGIPLSYQTTAMYSSFPSHISRFPEQKISSPSHTDRLFSESRPGESERHSQHMDKVRFYHQSLQEQSASHSVCSTSASDVNPSSSVLFSALRRKLGELDNIQKYFNQKLSTPLFPSMTEQDRHTQAEATRNSETDTSQLLLKSNQLVGEVNDIISGLKRHHQETIPSNALSGSMSPPVEHDSPQIIPESISSPHGVIDVVSPLPSLPTEMSEDHTNSEPEEEKDGQNSNISEDEQKEETSFRQDEEEEEYEDYEEVVLNPRPLNEVTSLTDRTSPWTSILSDPELVSVESTEAPKDSDLSEAEGEKRLGSEGEHRAHSCDGSDGEPSDTERNNEGTLREAELKPNSPDKSSVDSDSSATPPPDPDTPDVSGPQDSEDTELQTSLPLEVPNFFLPSHQLEASLRVIRLAPSFSKTLESGQNSSHHGLVPPRRRPRHRPNMSPSSMRKETERIAKIFSAHFDHSPAS